VMRGLRRLAPLVARLGGVVMLLTGAYVAYYGWYEAAVLRGDDPRDAVIETAASVQERLAGGVGQAGAGALLAVLALLVTASLILRHRDRRQPRPDHADEERPVG
jgi:cytochrome c-type biogenesis protein